MIKLFTGSPGSGKTYNMADTIRRKLRSGVNIISTVPIDLNYVSNNGKRKIGKFVHIPVHDITPDKIQSYMVLFDHQHGVESQTLVFIDECQIIFNTRNWNQQGRMEWIIFFTCHRHLGFDIYLITQNDGFVDKQIRNLIEIEVKHRKINHLFWFLPVVVFMQREEWYGHTQKIKLSLRFVICRPSVFKTYDSYAVFHEIRDKYLHLIEQEESEEEENTA